MRNAIPLAKSLTLQYQQREEKKRKHKKIANFQRVRGIDRQWIKFLVCI